MSIFPSRFSDSLRIDPGSPCQGHLKKLVKCTTARVIPPQYTIFSQGESLHTICLICSGFVKLTRTESNGKRVIIGLRTTGWMLGAVAIVLGVPYSTTAETVTRSKLCFVPIDHMKQEKKTNALFSQWISTILSRELYVSVRRISERCCLSGRKRLEKFLWEVFQAQEGIDQKGPARIQMVLKNWEVAQLLALTPQHLSRVIRQMESEGVMMRKKGWLIIPNPKRLWHSGKASPGIPESK